MEQKKTGKEPLLWLVCAVAIYFGFTRVLALFTKMLGMKMQEYFLLAIALLAGLLLLVFLPMKYLANRFKWQTQKDSVWSKWLIFILCFAGALMLRLYYMEMLPDAFYPASYMAGSAEATFFSEDSAAYDTAGLLMGRNLMPQGFFARDLYLWFLTLIFSFTGASVKGCMLFNLFLQMGALCLIYPAVRKLAGTVPAVISALLLAFFPVIAKNVCVPGYENLLLFLIAGLLALSSVEYANLMHYSGKTIEESTLYLCIWGFLSGIILAVSLEAVSVIILTVGLILGNSKVFDEKRKTLVYISFVFIGLALLFSFFYLFPGKGADIGLVVKDWYSATISSTVYQNVDKRYFSECKALLPIYLTAFLVLLGGYGSFAHEKAKYWSIPLGLSIFFAYSRTDRPGDQLVLLVYLSVFSGMGIAGMIEPIKRDKIMDETGTIQEVLKKEPESVQDVIKQEEDSETPAGVYLKNPLPVPKRHVKKVMDYDFEPAEEMLHFDIEISADDDFDLK